MYLLPTTKFKQGSKSNPTRNKTRQYKINIKNFLSSRIYSQFYRKSKDQYEAHVKALKFSCYNIFPLFTTAVFVFLTQSQAI